MTRWSVSFFYETDRPVDLDEHRQIRDGLKLRSGEDVTVGSGGTHLSVAMNVATEDSAPGVISLAASIVHELLQELGIAGEIFQLGVWRRVK
jgi:hypothetical protein